MILQMKVDKSKKRERSASPKVKKPKRKYRNDRSKKSRHSDSSGSSDSSGKESMNESESSEEDKRWEFKQVYGVFFFWKTLGTLVPMSEFFKTLLSRVALYLKKIKVPLVSMKNEENWKKVISAQRFPNLSNGPWN